MSQWTYDFEINGYIGGNMGTIEVRDIKELTRDELLALFREVMRILPPMEEISDQIDNHIQDISIDKANVYQKNCFSKLRGFFSFTFWFMTYMTCSYFYMISTGNKEVMEPYFAAAVGIVLTLIIKIINNARRTAGLNRRTAKANAEIEKLKSEYAAYKIEHAAAFLFLPPDYRRPDQIRKMNEYIENYRADNLKEAVNLLEAEGIGL